MATTSTTLASDQGKFIQDKLISLSEQLHKLPQFCDKVGLEGGNGKTANMIQYKRVDVAVDKLSEGVTPPETAMTIGTQSVVVEHWGLFITLTDVAEVTTKHPVLNQALKLVADAIARTQDYNIAEVLALGTNKQYWDGTRATRGAITSTDVMNKTALNKAVADMGDKGSPTREGDYYVLVVSPQVAGDLINETGDNSFFKAAQSGGDMKSLERGVIGFWLGCKIVRSNFLPKYTKPGSGGITPTAGAGGSLSGTVYHKITRKSTSRGFEEDIFAEANTVMGANTRLTFTAPSTSGYVYNVYAGSATGDANLFIAKENLAPSGIFLLDTLPTTGATAPAVPPTSVVVHPCYMFAAEAVDMVEITALSMNAMITPKGPSDSDPLGQRRKTGAKYMQKAGIRDNNNIKTIEVATAL